MKTFKRITVFLFILFTNFLILAQDNLRLDIEGDGITTETILQQGFESGFGTFTTNGDVTWAIQNTIVYAGSFSAQSGALTGDGQSNITTSIVVPDGKMGVLSFFARFDNNYTNYSDFTLTVDGNAVWSVDDQTNWVQNTLYLDPGSHILIWSVNQNYLYGYYGNMVTGYLDNVQVTYNDDHAVRIEDGNEGIGKVLTSDSQGNATWLSTNSLFNGNANLPLFLNGSSSEALLKINQSGTGGAIEIDFSNNNFSDAIRVNEGYIGLYASGQSNFGTYSFNSNYMGGIAVSPSSYGFYSSSAGNDGFYSSVSADDGMVAYSSSGVGLYSYSSGEQGVLSSSSAGDGISSVDAGAVGISSLNATGNGITSIDAGENGLYISNAASIGVRSDNSGLTDFYSFNSGQDGFFAYSPNGSGYYTFAPGAYGLLVSSAGSYGVYVTSATTYAGRFLGDVAVVGDFSKSSGTFKIDHPVDPENKYLYHSFVESPDMKNIYDGNVVLDNNGEATVTMPHYFEVLNREFRYQLTCIGGFANVYIAEKIKDNEFKIAGGLSGLEVSWQVTGVRQDPYAERNRVQVEVDKEEEFKGLYLHPEVYDLDENKGIDYNIEKRDNERRAAKEAKILSKQNDQTAEEKLQQVRAKDAEENENFKTDQAYMKEIDDKMKEENKKK